MKNIPLTQGFVALVDDADYERVSSHKWYIKIDRRKRTKYAVGAAGVRMHRFILGLSAGPVPQVDHRDHDGLNNQRENLRVCTHGQNRSNTRKAKGTSQYKGVHLDSSKWIAMLKSSGRTKYLGTFTSELDAALAYDAAARVAFGEFACTNFPPAKPCVNSAPASMIQAGPNVA
jgi:hypothetical protein